MQISLLEFLFRISSSTELAHNLFSSRPELGRAFVSISRGEFEIDARVFINVLNKSLGERTKVWTLPCLKAEVSQVEIYKPREAKYTEFWVDFNEATRYIGDINRQKSG